MRAVEQTYNDRLGITAAFNLNILERLNREFDAHFNLRWFQHRVFCDQNRGRAELQLVSLRSQNIRIGGDAISLGAYETIRTARYFQYSPREFARLAESAGLQIEQVWMDEQRLCSVQYLEPNGWRNQPGGNRMSGG